MTKKKAQAITIDFIIAFIIFLSLISSFMYLWANISFQPPQIQQKGFSVSEYLLSQKIGEESIIDCAKLAEIAFEDYESLKSNLNVGPYDVWIEFSGIDASLCPSIRRNLDIMIVLDRSGSMSGQKLADAKNAAKSFVDKLNGTYDQSGLASFSTTALLNQQLLIMSSANKTALKNKIDSLDANGYTDIGDAIAIASTELISTRSKTGAARVQILLSDGNPNMPSGIDANQYSIDKAKQACKNSTAIYAISLGSDANRTLMQIMANITSGKEYYAPSSSQLQGIFDEIASEIAVSQNYGKIAPPNAKGISSVARIVSLNGRIMRMTVRIYEKPENEATRCE